MQTAETSSHSMLSSVIKLGCPLLLGGFQSCVDKASSDVQQDCIRFKYLLAQDNTQSQALLVLNGTPALGAWARSC